MIDFRYHLISIVAVLLALSLGILVGSGFLGDPLLNDIRKRVEEVNRANNRLLGLANDLRSEIDQRDEEIRAAMPLLIEDRLRDESVVMLVIEGTPGGSVGRIRDTIEEAGGRVSSTIRILEKMDLAGPAEQDQLALVLRAITDTPESLQEQAGRLLGSRAAQVSALAEQDQGNDVHPVEVRLDSLLSELQEADFVSVEADDEQPVDPSSLFLIVAGAEEDPPFVPHPFLSALSSGLAEGGATVLAAEPNLSTWEVVAMLRDDPRTTGVVATVDSADEAAGQIAVVLGLERAQSGSVSHYGSGPGATELLPEPEPEV